MKRSFLVLFLFFFFNFFRFVFVLFVLLLIFNSASDNPTIVQSSHAVTSECTKSSSNAAEWHYWLWVVVPGEILNLAETSKRIVPSQSIVWIILAVFVFVNV